MEALHEYSTYQAAAKALRQFSMDKPEMAQEFVVRIEKSPYAGWRLAMYPIDLYVDELADGRTDAGKSNAW